MSIQEIIQALKDSRFRASLSAEERSRLPLNPIGELLSIEDLQAITGGTEDPSTSNSQCRPSTNNWDCPPPDTVSDPSCQPDPLPYFDPFVDPPAGGGAGDYNPLPIDLMA